MILLAHLSDPHVGPIKQPRLRELAGKRLTGYVNWKRGRFRVHDMDMLEKISADLLAHHPDHVALTGDLVNIGLESEFVTAQRYLERLGAPEFVSVVPGNHDAYVRSSFRYMAATTAQWMTGDDGAPPASFPYVRVRNGVALIGVCSGIPTAPLLASGELGPEQMAALGTALKAQAAAGRVRVVMIHHPPTDTGATFGRGLRDARAFEKCIRENGAELVIHGHNHKQSVLRIKGPEHDAFVVGVASASAIPGSANHRAAYHLYRIGRRDGRVFMEMQVRGLLPGGGIGDVSRQTLC